MNNRGKHLAVIGCAALVLSGLALLTSTACGVDAPPNVVTSVEFLKVDGSVVPAVVCGAEAGTLNGLSANGTDVGVLRITSTGWPGTDTDTLSVRVSTADGLVALGTPTAGGAAEGGVTGSTAASGSLSISTPTFDVPVHANLTPGIARLTVTHGNLSDDYCVALAESSPSSIDLVFTSTASAPPNWTAYQVLATPRTSNGSAVSYDTAFRWDADNCAYLSSPVTVLGDGGTMTNVLYVPSG